MNTHYFKYNYITWLSNNFIFTLTQVVFSEWIAKVIFLITRVATHFGFRVLFYLAISMGYGEIWHDLSSDLD